MLWHSHICYQGVKGEILFDELKNSYGGYEHFGEKRFLLAKENVLKQIENGYSFENAVSVLREEFTSFIYDGHFKVDGIPLHHRDRICTGCLR